MFCQKQKKWVAQIDLNDHGWTMVGRNGPQNRLPRAQLCIWNIVNVELFSKMFGEKEHGFQKQKIRSIQKVGHPFYK